MCASPGTMCAFRAALGKFGLSISHSYVDTNFFPSGWLMLIGLLARLMFISGAPGWRKCPVAPASDIPISLHICMGLVALLSNSTQNNQYAMLADIDEDDKTVAASNKTKIKS